MFGICGILRRFSGKSYISTSNALGSTAPGIKPVPVRRLERAPSKFGTRQSRTGPSGPTLMQRVLHIRKVSRVNSGGKVRSTSAIVVVGDQNGNGGYGMGRGSDTASAVQKAIIQAQKNMKHYVRLEGRTIYHDMDHKYQHMRIRFHTAKPGHGVVANNYIHEICRCLGISDLGAKILGSRNPMNVIKATFEALGKQNTPETVAKMRGRKIFDVEMEYYGHQFTK